MSEEALDGIAETETQITEDDFFASGGEKIPEGYEVEETEQVETETKTEQIEEKTEQKEVEQTQQEQKTVPLAALHEERARRREMKQQMEAMESRLQQILEKVDRKPEIQAPNFEEEPLEAIKHNQEQLAKALEQQNQTLTQQQQSAQQEQFKQQLISQYQNDAARFAQQQPDFNDAYQYMYNSRVNELQAYGYTQDQIASAMQNEELTLAYQAIQNEMSPAEVIYQVAQARGYVQKHVQNWQETEQKSPDEAKLDMIAKGQEASKSLSNSGGKSDAEISLESLADMDDEEFDKMWDKLIGG